MNGLFLVIAGLLILLGLCLSQTVHERWLLLSLLAGGYLLASGLTGWSPTDALFTKFKTRKHRKDRLNNK